MTRIQGNPSRAVGFVFYLFKALYPETHPLFQALACFKNKNAIGQKTAIGFNQWN